MSSDYQGQIKVQNVNIFLADMRFAELHVPPEMLPIVQDIICCVIT